MPPHRSREYIAWQSAKTRCYNPRYHNFAHYGGRGIIVCDEWRDDAQRFMADMGPCPSGYSLDRIDNDGPYAPWNCRWADSRTQHSNTRVNVVIEANGERLTVAQWARRLGVSKGMLHARLRLGWTHERVVREPAQPYLRGASKAAKEFGLNPHSIMDRRRRGWSHEAATSTPRKVNQFG